MKRVLLGLILCAIMGTAAFAQDDDYKKGEFFAGFSHSQIDNIVVTEGEDDRAGFNGFNVSGVYNVNRYVGIKGDFSGTFRSDDISLTAGGQTFQSNY